MIHNSHTFQSHFCLQVTFSRPSYKFLQHLWVFEHIPDKPSTKVELLLLSAWHFNTSTALGKVYMTEMTLLLVWPRQKHCSHPFWSADEWYQSIFASSSLESLFLILRCCVFTAENISHFKAFWVKLWYFLTVAVITVEPVVQQFPCESAWKWGVWVMIKRESSELKQIVWGNIPPNTYFFWRRACSNV